MDWSWVQTFVVTARLGSQNRAARELGLTQPTVGRHLDALEQHLATALLVRSTRGVELTEAGRALFEQAEDLTNRFELLSRSAHGPESPPEGPVRISINEPVAVQMLPRWYELIRREFPRVELELVVDNRAANLSRRDADIAVRMFEPEQLDLVAKFVGSSALAVYAHEDYLACRGVPTLAGDLSGHTLIGADRDPAFHGLLRQLGMRPSDFALRTDSLLLQAESVFRGVAMGVLHDCVAECARTCGLACAN